MKIKAEKRTLIGKKTKNLRSKSKVPASIYGPKREPANILVDELELVKLYREVGVSKLFDLEVDGNISRVMIKEVQMDPLKDKWIHVSFYEIDPHAKLSAEIPVELIGISPAVKNNLGFLVNPYDALTVICLPKDLPEKITIDISNLNEVADSIAIREVKLPQGVEFPTTMDTSTSLAYIAPPQKEIEEEVVAPAEGEETGETKEGEEGEEKKEAEATKEGEEKPAK